MTSDDMLVERFLAGEIEAGDFRHEQHVRVAWSLARRFPEDVAFERLTAGIRGIAARAGNAGAYHETITRAWFLLVSAAERLDDWPELFDRSLLDRYYSRGRLASGRTSFVEPDLHPLELPPPRAARQPVADVLRRVPVAVSVLATRGASGVHATTTSSLASVSSEPAFVSVCLANGSRALSVLRESQRFALSVLAEEQAGLADRFADPGRPAGAAQFAAVPHHLTEFGPVIDTACAWLGCTVHALHECGDHNIVIGEVGYAEASAARPLVRHDGAYH